MQKDNFRISSSSLEERLLLLSAFEIDLETYLKNYKRPLRELCVSEEDFDNKLNRFNTFKKLFEEGYSVPAIIGKKEFYAYEFYVNKNVLIPRPETETLVEQALLYAKELNKKTIKVLDLCAGSGCIGLSLYKELEKINIRAELTLVDISEAALEVLCINRERYCPGAKIVKSDLFEELKGGEPYDVIVANPPYVTVKEYEEVSREVKKEPALALLAGEDGLDIIRRIVKEAKAYLNKGGALMIESGLGQPKEIKKMMEEQGFHHIEIINDITERPRFTCSRV